MFGSRAIYVDQKIVFILRRKQNPKTLRDDGIWIATSPEHKESLHRALPSLRPIEVFAERAMMTWLNLPEHEDGFEEAALEACRMVIRGDERIGKIPNAKVKATAKAKTKKAGLTSDDFRRIALSLTGAEEGSHMGSADFRVGGRIFATLASEKSGYGNLMLTPEQQADFVGEQPGIFLPIAGGWGRMGMTHIRLAEADEEIMEGALRAAWKVRAEKNAKTGAKKKAARKGRS
jgi:hypothetical protein